MTLGTPSHPTDTQQAPGLPGQHAERNDEEPDPDGLAAAYDRILGATTDVSRTLLDGPQPTINDVIRLAYRLAHAYGLTGDEADQAALEFRRRLHVDLEAMVAENYLRALRAGG